MLSQLDAFTSTGMKYLMHPEQIMAYQEGRGDTIISTHVSPEGRCNRKCLYCSVRNRKQDERIPLPVIQDYILKLMTRGLKAVILTGGGEPTLYPEINELIDGLHALGLHLGMITNGTRTETVEHWEYFDWARLSVNCDDDVASEGLAFPEDRGECVLGLSYIHANGNRGWKYHLAMIADKLKAEYVRVTADCLASPEAFDQQHKEIAEMLTMLPDKRFFHQDKRGRHPQCDVCHQSFFRPYLSEVGGGTVFPCGSLVLNNQRKLFHEDFALCAPGDILDYLDGKIKPTFVPRRDCGNCVFASAVEMLGTCKEGMRHAEFV